MDLFISFIRYVVLVLFPLCAVFLLFNHHQRTSLKSGDCFELKVKGMKEVTTKEQWNPQHIHIRMNEDSEMQAVLCWEIERIPCDR